MLATISKAQAEHRQRFRDALDWRRMLTPDKKRALEAYCYRKGLRDKDGQILAWHRFALRVYLEKVSFQLSPRLVASGKGLLVVKHPALFSVVQRRGEEAIEAHGNLSALEEAHITSEFQIEAELGDKITATTLPGLIFHFIV